MNWAAQGGHLEVVEFLHFNRSEGCTTLAMDRAAEEGHLEVVEFLNLNRTEGCDYALVMVMESEFIGNDDKKLDIIKYLVENGRGMGRLEEAFYLSSRCYYDGGNKKIKAFLGTFL